MHQIGLPSEKPYDPRISYGMMTVTSDIDNSLNGDSEYIFWQNALPKLNAVQKLDAWKNKFFLHNW